jgi:hypothetical protein
MILAVAAAAAAAPRAAPDAAGPTAAGSSSAALPPARRAEAARASAAADPACVAVQPFYWAIGDAAGVQADGRAGRRAPGADTTMPVASASKWVYAAYVVQRRHGELSADDVRFLTLTSGYTEFRVCLRRQTVEQCDRFLSNGRMSPRRTAGSTTAAATCSATRCWRRSAPTTPPRSPRT